MVCALRSQPRVFAGLLLLCAACEGVVEDPDRVIPGAAAGSGAPVQPGTPAASPGAEMARAADAEMRAQNPDLFELARMYFPSDATAAAPKRLFRLTRAQLDITTKALLPAHYKQTAAEVLPRDPLQTNYEYADNLSFNAANFTPYTRWVQELAASVRANPSSVVNCAAQNNAPACLETEAKAFVSKAFRGIVSPAQLDHFAKFYVSSVAEVGFADATADLVDLTLTSPQYVFREEVLTDASAGLLPAERLQHLTYTLADAPPHALGFALDVSAQLSSADGMQQALSKVLASP